MPAYDFACKKHGDFVQMSKFSDVGSVVCPKCGQPARKVFRGTPHVRLNWKAYDARDTGSGELVIRAGKQGKPSPQRDAAGKRA